MPQQNYRQLKKRKEEARKTRQTAKLERRKGRLGETAGSEETVSGDSAEASATVLSASPSSAH